MQQRIYFDRLAGIAVMLALVLFCTPALAAQFKAIMVNFSPGGGGHDKYKIYVKDTKYHLVKLDGHTPPVIMNRDTGVTCALYPGIKKYAEIDKENAIFVNPILLLEMIPKILKAEKKHEGTETINGYVCDKYVYVLKPEQKVSDWQRTPVEVWVSQKLNHFIKGIFHQDKKDTILELRNIQEGPLDDALFKIPQGYEKIVEP